MFRFWIFGLVGLGIACASVSSPKPNEVQDADTRRVLFSLFDAEWERRLAEEPVFASLLGDRRYNREWADSSLAGLASRYEKDKQALAKLEAIEVKTLSAADRVHRSIAMRGLSDRVREYELGWQYQPVSHRGGVHTLNTLGQRLRLSTARDYDDWIARLKKIDRVVEQTIEVMSAGIAKGIVRPRVNMERVPRQIGLHVVVNPEDSPFWSTFDEVPDGIAERERILSDARDVIANTVVPAYRRFQTYFNRVYLPACRDSVGASELPNGTAWYDHAVARFTTTNLSAEEIHQIGLSEVARIRGEMLEVMKDVEFDGDFDAFKTFLRTDPQFYYETPEALLEGYLAMSKRLDPELVKLFGRLPRIPYGVKPIPDAIAPDTTTAYYTQPAADGSRPGYFWVNLYDVKSRPKWEMAALSVHEAVPGHHLQIALAMELEGVPEFRKHYWVTAFGEGWGLYSERLGYEMGLYDDPYARFGQLTYDMWRAVRLVVDTGMHAKGWSRERAIAYFLEHAPKSELDITNEIDRYISWPGQALAYKIGQLEILRLRTEAESRLGERFDLRAFHDMVLGSGGIPLDVLADNVERWIARQDQ